MNIMEIMNEISLLNGSVIFLFLFGITSARSNLHSVEQSPPPYRVKQCREGCLEKFYTKELACIQQAECSMCWDQCTLGTKINSNLSTWSLRTVSMIRNDSLVTADVAWQTFNTPCQYLVTWEISGGGLKGNLITETPTVQLSLWPDTVYRVQITCRNKDTQVVTHSLPLILNTSNAVVLSTSQYSDSDNTASSDEHHQSAEPSTSYSNTSPETAAPVPSPSNTKDIDVDASSMITSSKKAPQPALRQHHFQIEDIELQQLKLKTEDQLYQGLRPQQSFAHHYTFNSKLLGVWTLNDSRREIFFGAFVSILLSAIALSIVVMLRRRRTRNVNDKQTLMDSEWAQSDVSNQSTPVHETRTLHF